MNIDFKPFEFPNWEEWKSEHKNIIFYFGNEDYYMLNYSMKHMHTKDIISGEFFEQIIVTAFGHSERFYWNEKEYKRACDWLNQQKYNLAKQLSE